MRDLEFTFDWYSSLLSWLSDQGYTFDSFDDGVADGTVYLRHDVDFSPEKARRMARIESDRDVSATYFFLLRSSLYNTLDAETESVVREIIDLGHDVALHFDANHYWTEKPEQADLVDRVKTEQSILGSVADDSADVVAFHNPIEWVFGETFEGITHTYEPRFFGDIGYLADSNQRWREQRPFRDPLPKTLQILAHPVLWDDVDQDKNSVLRTAREYYHSCVDDAITTAMLDDPPQPTR
jgi:hypothetical protein